MKIIKDYLTLWVQLIFIALKLLKVISWAWLWVISPLWVSLTLASLIIMWAYYDNKKSDTK
jgi:hypothetical protein